MDVGEDVGSGAVANGVVDSGCGAFVGTGTCISSGAGTYVEANDGVGEMVGTVTEEL